MSEDKIHFCYYLVAFIDLLGQREEMRKFRKLPQSASGPEYEEFISIVKNTIGKISNLQETCKTYFDSYVNAPSRVDIPDEHKNTFEKLGKTSIKFQHFSDGLVIFVPLREAVELSPIGSVYGVLTACAGMMLHSLATESPIRGGITVGLGAELNDGEIYGPVVGAAYELESQIAQYPRLVVGNELCAYLDHFDKKAPRKKDLIAAYNIEISNLCKRFLIFDYDGYPIIHYMGDFMVELTKNLENEEAIKQARKFIAHSLRKFQKIQNSKLAFRYNLLHSYFESNLKNWIENA